MLGSMMNIPLNIADILKYAAEIHPTGEIVSVRTEGDIHRTTYRETLGRVSQLAHALRGQGVEIGDRIATLAWNGYRHFELYYAISGSGAVCHTINPRLSAEQMTYIVTHAEDTMLFVDTTFVPLVAALRAQWPAGLKVVVMTGRAHMPEGDYLCYEDLLEGQPESFDWPVLDENTASGLCYTSGTTGNPKGTLYSHRSTVLHAFMEAVGLPDVLQPGRAILPVVPLFHVNAWGLPYAAPLTGASLVFPGGALDGESLFKLMESESVYSAWGVPTVWLGLQGEIAKQGRLPKGLADVVVGGSAAPASMIRFFEENDVNVCHAWGMTEMSPIGTTGNLPPHLEHLPLDEKLKIKAKQGRRTCLVELKILDEDGQRLPHDGVAAGELFVRGPAITAGYFKNDEANQNAFDSEGWFGTGDVATIDANGYLNITDRAKDLIKSGGEWISSLDLENTVMAHPKVANCAVIAIAHPKWDERPLLVVVPSPDGKPEVSELMGMLDEHFAKWQLPDDVVFVDELPLTATGKVSKLSLRKQFADYKLPDA
ncbi:long-chain-fatty-acid--CoA ligase [Shimia aestuarii]|uniref:3-methylmercaptopropionyl-CoA ligase n=1 Tax=Shimia aestuarii TaxID=254406 RepID=A0A1I4S0C8_9RHOB|nr:long-chain-fatty-acid--CoA ligase [Shimia aestuarii]SFM57925.1 fatty-acyl-CoA synthase [Shimia aestuarii]